MNVYKISLLILSAAASSCAFSNSQKEKNIPVQVNTQKIAISAYFNPPLAKEDSSNYTKMLTAKWIDTYQIASIKTGKEKAASSCEDYLKSPLPNWEPLAANDFPSYQLMASKCGILSLLAKAKSSTISFVSDIKASKSLVKNLPKQLAFITSTSEYNKIILDESVSKLVEVSKPISILIKENDAIEIKIPGGIQEISIVAKGDFNNDSTEDLLLTVSNSSTEGSYTINNNFVVTRFGLNEDFKVVGD